MKSKKTSSTATANSEQDKKLSAEALQVVMKEFDTMMGLFSGTETSIQGIFNFYITLATAVVGGIALILQFPANSSSEAMRSQAIVCGLLILASIIGTIYLLSIVYRYSRLIEYGRNLDALRLFLMREFNVPMPPVYSRFLAEPNPQSSNGKKSPLLWLAWLLPVGTYQFTMAFINSCAFTVATWILRSMTGIAVTHFYDSLFVIFLEFFLILNVYNLYSRLMLKRWTSTARMHLNPQVKHPFQMIR